ncbi:MAG: hypothetical protein ABIV51_04555 [Saprospiraceae bacterium]
MTLDLVYRYIYDNAPNKVYFADNSPEGRPVYLIANNKHQLFNMRFGVTF